MDADERRTGTGAVQGGLIADLREVRARTLRLTEGLSSDQWMGPMLPTVNPLLWEVGHVGWFHEFWTLRHVHGERPVLAQADQLWNSSAVAHGTRWDLDLPDRNAVLALLSNVLERQLARIDRGIADPDVYFYQLAVRHEDMHVEALSYTRQTLRYPQPAGLGKRPQPGDGGWRGDADVPGGRWRLGANPGDGFVFDNEKWAHPVELAPYRIARSPVTNAEFAEFVEAGGYRTRQFWSDEGWAWRERTGAEMPVYWHSRADGRWIWRRYDRLEELRPDAPVVFVNWYEAQAWCRFAGRRLPTEAEWEAAAVGEATVDGARLADTRRPWPWGDAEPTSAVANLDFRFDSPLDTAACPGGDSAFGCRQMIGNVWEWTASDFLPFPGFRADPYEDYSQPWFGTRKVLRGGAWATSARIARPGYRNFFTPDRNDVIAGFRTCTVER